MKKTKILALAVTFALGSGIPLIGGGTTRAITTDADSIGYIESRSDDAPKYNLQHKPNANSLQALSARADFEHGVPANEDTSGKTQTFTDDTINQTTLFDGFQLNINTLPNVEIANDDGQCVLHNSARNDTEYRVVNCADLTAEQATDTIITAEFPDAATIKGRKANMTIKYSDLVPYDKLAVNNGFLGINGSTNGFLAWSAYGQINNQANSNEWFYAFQSADMDISFTWADTNEPINIYNGYFTLYSVDGYFSSYWATSDFYQLAEATNSDNANMAYVYPNTKMEILPEYTFGDKKINNVYYGTIEHSAPRDESVAVTYEYKNTDHMNIGLHVINGEASPGYHINFTPLGYNVDFDKLETTKTVDKDFAKSGDQLTYTIKQNLPTSDNADFRLSSVVLNDQLDNRLTFDGIKVFDENGKDVTSEAGKVSVDSSNKLTFTFSEDYLEQIACVGQEYTFVITTTVKYNIESGDAVNNASATFDYYNTSKSNDVTTNLESVAEPQVSQPAESPATDNASNGAAAPGAPNTGVGIVEAVKQHPAIAAFTSIMILAMGALAAKKLLPRNA